MPRITTTCLLLVSLALCSLAGVAQTQPTDSPPAEDPEAILRQKEKIRTLVDTEANPGSGTSQVKPGAVWRAHEDLLGEDLEITGEVLSEILVSGDRNSRILSARLLGNISGREVRRWLRDSAEQDPSPSVRLAALDGLRIASAFLEVCSVLHEHGQRHDDAKRKEFSSIEAVRKAQRHLETTSVVALDASTDLPPPPVLQEGVVGSKEAERIVAKVLEDITDASGGHVDGITAYLMRPLIDPEHRDRIWRLGPAAIRPLTQRAWGKEGTGYDLTYDWTIAKRLLWELGGIASIEPVSEIVLTHPQAHIRMAAMESLLYGNGFFEVWDFLEERIQGEFETEKDATVRARAIAYRNACLAAG